MNRGIVLALLGVLLFSVPSWAAEAGNEKNWDRDQPIRVNSDRLEANDVSRQVTFVGNVVARQGGVVIYAEKMTVFYGPKQRQIDRVEAHQDVRIVQGPKVATGQHGTFYQREGRIVLSGGARVHQGEDFVEGEEITVFLNEERSVVRGEKGSRVNAVLHPKGESE